MNQDQDPFKCFSQKWKEAGPETGLGRSCDVALKSIDMDAPAASLRQGLAAEMGLITSSGWKRQHRQRVSAVSWERNREGGRQQAGRTKAYALYFSAEQHISRAGREDTEEGNQKTKGEGMGSALGQTLFNILIGNMDSGIECTLIKFADDTDLCGVVDTLEGRDAIQRELDRPERWTDANLMKSKEAKCKAQHLGQGNPKHKSGWE
ncbi:hypothetical protein BTVI_121359 [Pitangus sulphuratus]|nr:hypothetical protein BTVI_121359 [Pitangus sulphuratus]